jgi:hypothetical protein
MSTTTDSGLFDLQTLTPLHYLGVLLAVVSGLIHLQLGIGFISSPLGISFLFAGVVFVLASVAILANFRRRLLYGLGIPFTAGQIVIWYVFNFAMGSKSFPADVGTLGAIDKVAQVVLVVVLIALLQRE